MPVNPSQLRANLRLVSGLTMFSFVLCHFTAHASLLVSLSFGQAALDLLMKPWQSLAGIIILTSALTVHYLNALWSIYRRRSLRLSRWELWQLGLGLSIPLLLTMHVVDTMVGSLALETTPTYASSFIGWWVRRPWLGVLQFTTLLVVWTHACIGINFWLRTKPWFPRAVGYLRPAAILFPTLALAGYITAGNQVRNEVAKNPDYAGLIEDDSNYTPANKELLGTIALMAIGGHILLTALPFGARVLRDALYRRRRPPTLTHASGKRFVMQPGASVLETQIGRAHV